MTTHLWGQRQQLADMPPLIITCATSGGFTQADNPNLPQTAEEQAETARLVEPAGASIIHIHGRTLEDPTKMSNQSEVYLRINSMIRANAPHIIIDNTQTVASLATNDEHLQDAVHYYKSAPMFAKPEIMSLNPGPMTFRGGEQQGAKAYVATFDTTLQAALEMRERNIKPQVFLYHPGHLDLLAYLIQHDALETPYFVQLVFGQQSGIPCNADSVLYMVRQLPDQTIFQTCALGLDELEVNLLSILLGGHVRTGMEDSVEYRKADPATGNKQFVDRIVRIASDIGRRIATPQEARTMLGLGAPTAYDVVG